MLSPVIQKVIFSKKAFVERRISPAEGKFFVKEGSRLRPFDFVAEIKDTVRQRLTAGVGGEVVKILPGKAVLIKTSAVIIRGVAGSGEDSEGEIRIAADHNETIRLEAVDANGASQILVGGNVLTLEVFKKAEAVGAKGIVCGGADFSAFEKTTLPTLIIEGFGRPPLNHQVFEFLKSVEGRHVFLSPEHKELLVARHVDRAEDHLKLLDAQSEEVTEPFVELKRGMEVQVFTSANFGQMGKVEKVGPPASESPQASRAGESEVGVLLESGDRIEVPGRNVGIIK